MKTTKVIVEPYNAAWKSAFEDIRQEIETAIGNLIIGIEHVGSTSVEGLSAKPSPKESNSGLVSSLIDAPFKGSL